MCLMTTLAKNEKDKILRNITKNGKKVFKVVRVVDGKYYPLFQYHDIPFEEGPMEAIQKEKICMDWYADYKEYKAGFHFWIHRKDAQKVVENIKRSQKRHRHTLLEQFQNNAGIRIITCIVKKSWINVMGNDATAGYEGKAIVAKKAIFPIFRG